MYNKRLLTALNFLSFYRLLIFPVFLLLANSSIIAQNAPVPAFESLTDFPRVRDITLNADRSEAWFTLQSMAGDISVIAFIKKTTQGWSEPIIAPFSGKYRDLEPAFSSDGKQIWFASNRPLCGIGSPKDFDLWYSEWDEEQKIWKQPSNPGSPMNSEHDEYFPSVALSGNVYFTSTRPGSSGEDDIFMCEWNNGQFSHPVALAQTINSAGAEYNAFVAPDESFIIFSAHNRPGGLGNGDLFVSFRNDDNQWQEATNLGPNINSAFLDYSPFVDLNDQVLYFTSNRRTPSHKTLTTLQDFTDQIKRYENGLLRLYKVSIEDIEGFGNR